MTPLLVFGIIAFYFTVLIIIAFYTSRKASNRSFFIADKQAPWYVVAFGMVGATLSGVTFISVPGEVGAFIPNTIEFKAFSYFQMVLGYLVGYFVIANVLLPMYYRLNLISIYSYLKTRFGFFSYKTGSLFFLLSQSMGASLRLMLVSGVLQLAFFNRYHIPFEITALVTILLIWVYTFKGGMKTIIWTDIFQTFFMLLAVVLSIVIISNELKLNLNTLFLTIKESPYSKIWFWDWQSSRFFIKQFVAGAFIAVVMTGLDQNMMQKNLTCRTLPDAKKNIYWLSIILVIVNFLFLSLGVLLYVYSQNKGIAFPASSDDLYPLLAIEHFPLFAGIVFLLGIIAAAFSSADSSLTALTTAFCIDFLKLEKHSETKQNHIRLLVHVVFSVLMYLIIVVFGKLNDKSVISAVFTVAGYTYGPLLGLFAFGLFTKIKIRDGWLVPVAAILSPLLSYLISLNSKEWFWGYQFGFELLLINGALMFLFLFLLSLKKR
jgi:Na+/proline symporter